MATADVELTSIYSRAFATVSVSMGPSGESAAHAATPESEAASVWFVIMPTTVSGFDWSSAKHGIELSKSAMIFSAPFSTSQ